MVPCCGAGGVASKDRGFVVPAVRRRGVCRVFKTKPNSFINISYSVLCGAVVPVVRSCGSVLVGCSACGRVGWLPWCWCPRCQKPGTSCQVVIRLSQCPWCHSSEQASATRHRGHYTSATETAPDGTVAASSTAANEHRRDRTTGATAC